MSEQSLPPHSSGSATGIFPLEVWGCFLDTLLESGGAEETDVGLNLINSSTQLQKTFRKEKFLLAFRKALPLLFYKNRWLFPKDMLRLRLVSKNFNRAVHVYVTEMETREQDIIHTGYIPRPEELDEVEGDLHRFRLDKGFHFDHWRFFKFQMMLEEEEAEEEEEADKTVAEYKEDLDNCPEFPSPQVMKTVPLLGLRSLKIYFIQHHMDVDEVGKVWSFMEGINFVLGRVGKHVWSFSFTPSFNEDDDELWAHSSVWKYFLEVLAKLGNLRNIRIEDFDMECGHHNWEYPPLPKLESIEIKDTDTDTCAQTEVLNPLIHHYSSQLLRLSVDMFEAKYLEPERFTKLTELEISGCDRNEDFDLVRRFLDNLPSPLVRLVLKFECTTELETEVPEVDLETEVLHWLEKFPTLESLSVYSGDVLYIKEANSSSEAAEQKSFPNLKFLRMEGGYGGLQLKLLRRFPSLQYLYVIANPFLIIWDESVLYKERKRIRKGLEQGRLYNSDCWEFLPELKTVTIQIPLAFDRYDYFHFHRERYERIKLGKEKKAAAAAASKEQIRREGGGSDEEKNHCDDHPPRKDVLEQLERKSKKKGKRKLSRVVRYINRVFCPH